MQYEVSTPGEYLETLDADWRRDTLIQLRTLIQRLAPELEEIISYKMLGYRLGEKLVLSLNAQKAYVSLYLGEISKVDPTGSLLSGLKTGKGCIKFSKSVQIEKTKIETFLKNALDMARSGQDIGC